MLLRSLALLIATALTFKIPLQTVYTATEVSLYQSQSHISTQVRLIRGDTSLYHGDGAVVTTLNVSILYTHIDPDPYFYCNPTEGYKTETGKFGKEELCGRYQNMIIILDDMNGSKLRYNITVFNVIRHSVIQVTPRVKFHFGIAFQNSKTSTLGLLNIFKYALEHFNGTYYLTDEFDVTKYNLETAQDWDYEPGTPYHYYQIQLTGVYIEGYQSYSTFNDNLVLFDTGIGYMEFFEGRFDQFYTNFVETYCDDNRQENGKIRCNCEGKNFNNLPQIRWAINTKSYQLGPDSYLFDAYIDPKTYITWCELGIKNNQFTTNVKTDFNIIGSLFFREYNVAFVQDPTTYIVQIGVQGGDSLSRIDEIIGSSIIYAVVVLLLFILVLWLSYKRHKRLKFEEVIKQKDPNRYYEVNANIEAKKHYHRLEANMGNINDHHFSSELMEQAYNDLDPKVLERIEKDQDFQRHVQQQADKIKRQRTMARNLDKDFDFD